LSSFNPLNAYRQTNIKTASQGKLIIMLYDEAIKQLNLAVEQIEQHSLKLDGINNAIIRAQEMITELMVSLDFEKGGEIAQTLFSLYMFFNRQLMEANMKKEAEPIRQVSNLLQELREAWIQVVHKERGGADTLPNGVNIAG